MVGGQVVDVESEKSDDCPITREKLDFIYRLKTGALIELSLIHILQVILYPACQISVHPAAQIVKAL